MNQTKQTLQRILFTLFTILLLAIIPTNILAQTNPTTEALHQAVTDTFSTEMGEASLVDNWALFSLRPSGEVAIAQWDGATWQIVTQTDDQFSIWLAQLPEDLISVSARSYLQPAEVGTASYMPELRLPFPAEQTWRYLAGPHASPYRRAVDFGPLGRYDQLNPYAPFTGRERDVTASADGVVIDKDTNMLVIRHESGWETVYYGLAQSSIVLTIGDPVYAGDLLGLASDEVDHEQDVRVSFWVRRYGVDQTSADLALSGWHIFLDNSYESGHGKGTIVYQKHLRKIDCQTVAKHYFDFTDCHVTHFVEPLLRLNPRVTTLPQRSTGQSTVEIVNVYDLRHIEFEITQPIDDILTPLINVTQAKQGDLFNTQPDSSATINDNPASVTTLVTYSATFTPTFSGSGTLLDIQWRDLGLLPGESFLTLTDVKLHDAQGNIMPATLQDGILQVLPNRLVEGRINLHNNQAYQNITMVMNGQPVQLDDTGHFSVATEGAYQIMVTAPQHLSVQLTGESNDGLNLGDITMMSGDVTADDQIDVLDMAYIGQHYQTTDANADLNGDGSVDIFDLALAATNYGQTGANYSVGN